MNHKLGVISSFALNCHEPSVLFVGVGDELILDDGLVSDFIETDALSDQFTVADIFIVVVEIVLCSELFVVHFLHFGFFDLFGVKIISFGYSYHPYRHYQQNSQHYQNVDSQHKQVSFSCFLVYQYRCACQRYGVEY